MTENVPLTPPETFREFYQRRTGIVYPGANTEDMYVVLTRIASELAAWADELAARMR